MTSKEIIQKNQIFTEPSYIESLRMVCTYEEFHLSAK